MSPKKPLIVYVLKVMESNTDRDHPMTQVKIAEWIDPVLPCDRKTVGRNIKTLQAMGYPIVKTSKGFYMDRRQFNADEIRFVLRAVMFAEGKDEEEKVELYKKLHRAFQVRWW